jgi:hypothetical protein
VAKAIVEIIDRLFHFVIIERTEKKSDGFCQGLIGLRKAF